MLVNGRESCDGVERKRERGASDKVQEDGDLRCCSKGEVCLVVFREVR